MSNKDCREEDAENRKWCDPFVSRRGKNRDNDFFVIVVVFVCVFFSFARGSRRLSPGNW